MPSVDESEREFRERLTAILRATPPLMRVLSVARHLCLPDWLVFSGAVYQPPNHLTGRPLDYGVRDYDLAYFDASDLSYEAEDGTAPRNVGQRIAMKQKQRRATAAMPQADARAAGLDVSQREARHDFHGHPPQILRQIDCPRSCPSALSASPMAAGSLECARIAKRRRSDPMSPDARASEFVHHAAP
jgi:hypothetical protein